MTWWLMWLLMFSACVVGSVVDMVSTLFIFLWFIGRPRPR